MLGACLRTQALPSRLLPGRGTISRRTTSNLDFLRIENRSFIRSSQCARLPRPTNTRRSLKSIRGGLVSSPLLSTFDGGVAAADTEPLRAVALRAVGGLLRFFSPRAMASPPYSPQDQWWSPDTVAIVTGSNKGIGYDIAKGLAGAGLLTVLTSRDPALGEKAAAQLRASGRGNVVYHQLDISDKASIDAFAQWLNEKHGGLDILINNAGVAYKGSTFGAQEAETTIATNYRGTRAVTEALLPLLKPSPQGARIVNVSSQAGLLGILSPGLQKRLLDESLTLDQLDALAQEFVSGIEKGTYRAEGWPQSMYGVSKVLESAYTRVLARQLSGRPEGQRVFVNACCPGWCATDMSSHSGPRTPEQGADTPIFLALQPATQAKSGLFFFDRRERGF